MLPNPAWREGLPRPRSTPPWMPPPAIALSRCVSSSWPTPTSGSTPSGRGSGGAGAARTSWPTTPGRSTRRSRRGWISSSKEGFAAVLAGHVHRAQVLRHGLDGRPARAPVVYPGSLERTAFAERGEPKGFLVLDMVPGASGGSLVRCTFRPPDTRPMEVRPLRVGGLTAESLSRELRRVLASVAPDTVLRLEADGPRHPGPTGCSRPAHCGGSRPRP